MSHHTGIALMFYSLRINKRALLWTEVLLLLLLVNNAYAQSESSYLKSLAGEASGMRVDEQTRNIQNDPVAISEKFEAIGGGDISELVSELTEAQFEEALKNNYIGSYLFYKRLTVDQKKDVYSYYQSNPDPQKLRNKILQMSKK